MALIWKWKLLTKIPLLCSLEKNTIINPHVKGTLIPEPKSCDNNNQDIIFLTPLEGEEEGRVSFVKQSWVGDFSRYEKVRTLEIIIVSKLRTILGCSVLLYHPSLFFFLSSNAGLSSFICIGKLWSKQWRYKY